MLDRYRKIKEAFQQIHPLDRTFVITLFFAALFSGFFPYVRLFFLAPMFHQLAERNIAKAMRCIFWMLCVEFLIGNGAVFLEQRIKTKAHRIQLLMQQKIQEKMMRLPFSIIENDTLLKRLSDAKYTMSHTGGYTVYFQYVRQIMESFVQIVLSVGMISSLCFSTGEKIPGWIIFDRPAISFLFVILLFLGNGLLMRQIEQRSKSWDTDLFYQKIGVERKFSYFIDHIFFNRTAQRDIRVFQAQDFIAKKYRELLEESQDFFQTYYIQKQHKKMIFILFLQHLFSAFVYFVCLVKVWTRAISIGTLVQNVGAFLQMNEAIKNLLQTNRQLLLQDEFIATYQDFMNLEEPDEKKSTWKQTPQYTIEMSHVFFRYPGDTKDTLHDINLSFTEKSNLALVGLNGSGKSTLIKVLVGLYEPTSGEITCNGISRTHFSKDDWFSLFGIVFQDFTLFPFTIKENIVGEEREKDIFPILQKLKMDDVVSRLTHKEQTLICHVDAESENLSKGQEQKIAIARAIMKDAPFLIFDEPTSALDPIAEENLYGKIHALTKEKSTLFISHRMSSCKKMENIIVLDQGTIIEKGSHPELMKKQGLYYRLFESQAQYYR